MITAKQELPETFKLRLADERECLAIGLTGIEAVKQSIKNSDFHHVVYDGDEMLAAWGYGTASIFNKRCRAWLLTCDPIDRMIITFSRVSVKVMKFLFSSFEEVEVLVHNDYKRSIKWLLWLGFEADGRSKDFTRMVAYRSKSRWVS